MSSDNDEWTTVTSKKTKNEAKRIVLGGMEFANYTKLSTHVDNVLRNAILDVPLDSLVVRELLEYHPDYESKLGSGIESICVTKHHKWHTRAFCILRTDGTAETFSIGVCLKHFYTLCVA